MSNDASKNITYTLVPGGVGFGVAYYVGGVYGFWWAVAYGMFWPAWVGYRLAAYLLGAHP